MDERKHIEDADIVVDISGGKLSAQTYRERIAELKSQIAFLKTEAVAGRSLWKEAQAGRKKLRLELDKADKRERGLRDVIVDGNLLFKWLKKAYDMGLRRMAMSAEISESDLPTLDLSYVPEMQEEIKQAQQGEDTKEQENDHV